MEETSRAALRVTTETISAARKIHVADVPTLRRVPPCAVAFLSPVPRWPQIPGSIHRARPKRCAPQDLMQDQGSLRHVARQPPVCSPIRILSKTGDRTLLDSSISGVARLWPRLTRRWLIWTRVREKHSIKSKHKQGSAPLGTQVAPTADGERSTLIERLAVVCVQVLIRRGGTRRCRSMPIDAQLALTYANLKPIRHPASSRTTSMPLLAPWLK